MIPGGKFWERHCIRSRFTVVCEKGASSDAEDSTVTTTLAPVTSPSVTKAPSTQSGCGRGWKSFGSSCFRKPTRRRLNWNQAKAVCGKQGSTLPVVTNAAENKFLVNFAGKRLVDRQGSLQLRIKVFY